MTTQKSFKRAVRERMAKTGERYTAARAHLLPAEEDAAPAAPAYEPAMSPDAVRSATGREWDEWFALLDEWGASDRPHKAIAAWLVAEHGVPGWWAQNVTVEYERSRGLRAPGSGRDGLFSVGASRTVAVPVDRLYEAFVDPEVRERWLPGDRVRERTVLPHRSARFDWEGGPTRLVVGFAEKGPAKAQVALAHERVPDAEVASELKAYWRERLGVLKALLES
jgi:uncharacterized protein DUF4287